MDIGKINTESKEGKWLLAAMAVITTECRTSKTPNEVLGELNNLKNVMFPKEQVLVDEMTLDEMVAFNDRLKPYKEFPNPDYNLAYTNGMVEGSKAMYHKIFKPE